MTYIRSLSQADWFFKPEGDLRPGGLTSLPSAPPPTAAGAPADMLPPPIAPVAAGGPPVAPPTGAPPVPAAITASSPATPTGAAPSAEPTEPESEEEIPALEEGGPPYGMYLLGGLGALVIGIFLYKKYGKKEVKVVKKVKVPAMKMTRVTTTTESTKKAKAKRKRKK